MKQTPVEPSQSSKNLAVAGCVTAMVGLLMLPLAFLGSFLGPPAFILALFGPRRGTYGVLTWTGVVIGGFLTAILVEIVRT